MCLYRFAAVLVLLALVLPASLNAAPQRVRRGPQFGGDPRQIPAPSINDAEHVKARNEERQRQLKMDTERLLELATELKQYVDKTNESVLSVEVIKKAEDIEKLAKSVREKMKAN